MIPFERVGEWFFASRNWYFMPMASLWFKWKCISYNARTIRRNIPVMNDNDALRTHTHTLARQLIKSSTKVTVPFSARTRFGVLKLALAVTFVVIPPVWLGRKSAHSNSAVFALIPANFVIVGPGYNRSETNDALDCAAPLMNVTGDFWKLSGGI